VKEKKRKKERERKKDLKIIRETFGNLEYCVATFMKKQ